VSKVGNETADYYIEQTGLWSIDLGSLDTSSPAFLNQMAERVTKAFWEGFEDICNLEWAEGDIVQVGQDGLIDAVSAEIPLEHSGDGRFRPTGSAGVGGSEDRTVLSRVMLTCGVTLQLPDGETRELPDSLHFHYDTGLPSTVGEPAKSTSASATVGVEVDPWLDAPWNLRARIDNRSVAALNRPRFEQALRKWETAIGKPISEVSSVPYPDLIDRYGFRPGGGPDPP
jgi:hypothetical protein